MTDDGETAPIRASDDEFRDALDVADLPPLLPALAYLTGDLGLFRDDVRVDPLLMGEDQGGLTPEQQTAVRDLALATLVRFRDAGGVAAPPASDGDLQRILEFMAGGLAVDEYLPMMREELALTADLRAPRWHKDDVNPDKPFSVVVIGAGMSGIAAAHRLHEANVPYVVLDKNPTSAARGSRTPIPAVASTSRTTTTAIRSPSGPTGRLLQPPVRAVRVLPVVRRRVRHPPNIRFNTDVSSVEYDDATATWTVGTVDGDGVEATIEANAVISASAVEPSPLPAIEGPVPLPVPCSTRPSGITASTRGDPRRCDRHRLQCRAVRSGSICSASRRRSKANAR